MSGTRRSNVYNSFKTNPRSVILLAIVEAKILVEKLCRISFIEDVNRAQENLEIFDA